MATGARKKRQPSLFAEGVQEAIEVIAIAVRPLPTSTDHELHFAIPIDVAEALFVFGQDRADAEPDGRSP